MNSATGLQALLKLHKNGVSLTQCAQDIIDMPHQDQQTELQLVCQQFKGEAPVQQSTVTCMTALKKAHDEVSEYPCLYEYDSRLLITPVLAFQFPCSSLTMAMPARLVKTASLAVVSNNMKTAWRDMLPQLLRAYHQDLLSVLPDTFRML